MRALALLLLVSCGSPVVEVESKGTVDITPPAQDWGRDWRRMDLDQLKASIERVSGGVSWSSPTGRDNIDMFDDLASTLGKPDYLQATREDLEPSLLFQKFLKDAANAVCLGIIEEDGRRNQSERQFVTELAWDDTWEGNPEGVKANLARLILRFHGRLITADTQEIEEWAWLFRSVSHVTDGNLAKSWNAVCVALMTHPDFYTY